MCPSDLAVQHRIKDDRWTQARELLEQGLARQPDCPHLNSKMRDLTHTKSLRTYLGCTIGRAHKFARSGVDYLIRTTRVATQDCPSRNRRSSLSQIPRSVDNPIVPLARLTF